MERRLTAITIIFSILLVGITGKAFYEQVIKGPNYASASLEMRTRQFSAEEYQRGEILDRNGISLTDAAYRPTLIIFPTLVKDAQTLAGRLNSTIEGLNISSEKIKPVRRKGTTIYPEPIVIRLDEDSPVLSDILRWKEPGVTVLPYKGRYGSNSLAVHLIGYMGFAEKGIKPQGMTGLEARFDYLLKGSRAEKVITPITDARNNILPGLGYRIIDLGQDQKRNDLVLTIDSRIQKITEEVMGEQQITKGGVVVLDIETGKILAAATKPVFDQNNLGKTMGFKDNQLERIIDYKVYPGSIFKVITAAAALEEGIVSPDSKFFCAGSSPDFKVKCPRPHGEITFLQAMEQSCNITFVQVGLQLGREKLEHYIIDKFGFYPIPSKALDSREAIAHGIIGQVIFEASPLEIANMLATIARDGYHQKIDNPWQTRLIQGVRKQGAVEGRGEIPRYERIYSKETARILKDLLTATNLQGSGRRAWIDGAGSAGKTGTPQVNGLGDYMAWYAGYAPLDNPKYAVAVLIEEIEGLEKADLQGGRYAAPVFKEIIERTLKLDF